MAEATLKVDTQIVTTITGPLSFTSRIQKTPISPRVVHSNLNFLQESFALNIDNSTLLFVVWICKYAQAIWILFMLKFSCCKFEVSIKGALSLCPVECSVECCTCSLLLL